MNADVKKAWLEALRSGAYQQGQGQLRQGDAYCCLGVLCDLHRRAVGSGWRKTNEDWSYFGNIAITPWQVVEWAGLPDDAPYIQGASLVTYNDGIEGEDPHTFTEIADLIEIYL